MSDLVESCDGSDLLDDRPHFADEERASFEKLTPKLREVLRLTLLRKSSKEIGRELGIAPRSVDQRLDAARIILRASNRFEAARIYYDLVCASEGLTSDPFLLGEGGSQQPSGGGEQSLYVFGDALSFPANAVWENSAEVEIKTWRRFVPGLPSAASGSGDRIMWIMIGALSILALVLIGLAVVDSLKRVVGGG